MDLQVLTTVLAGLLIMVGSLGTIIPVLPGSILIIAALVAWAWVLGSAAAWTAAAFGIVLALSGLAAGAVLTGRKLKQHSIPNWSILAAVAAGVAGMFIIPVVGLVVGFAVGLLVTEYARRRNFPAALRASAAALKATGIGILVEFGCACLAGSAWVLGVWVHFAGR
jgi:uncharacterized protein YqgC (DUF456 family)